MIERYHNRQIGEIWSERNKLHLWQMVELAVLFSRAEVLKDPTDDLGSTSYSARLKIYNDVKSALEQNPVDIEKWKSLDQLLHHDLLAFVRERERFLPEQLKSCFHEGMTSYDTEEPALVIMLRDSAQYIWGLAQECEKVLIALARKHRFTVMMGRTHDQEAELQTFGKRCLTWLQYFRPVMDVLRISMANLGYAKISGAVGNYNTIGPDIERNALAKLGLRPFVGATQILPRTLFQPVADSLCELVTALNKIAEDIRRGSRGPHPICREPFAKTQAGSSAMPHKRNPVRTEQISGMARMARHFAGMTLECVVTVEERAIEQSCVERVAWPDLFHVTAHSLISMTKILGNLRVYPENMLWEIVDSKGCYAGNHAKGLLVELCKPHGLSPAECYRIVQLAAFNIHSGGGADDMPCNSLSDTDKMLAGFRQKRRPAGGHLQEVIARGKLLVAPDELAATEEDVSKWNETLNKVFSNGSNLQRWLEIFLPSFQLRNEEFLYKTILGE